MFVSVSAVVIAVGANALHLTPNATFANILERFGGFGCED